MTRATNYMMVWGTLALVALVVVAMAVPIVHPAAVAAAPRTGAPAAAGAVHVTLSSSSPTAAYPFAGVKPTGQQQASFEATLPTTQQRLLYAKFVGFYHAP